MTFYQVPSLSLRENVVEQIRTAIIEGRLKPKDHIPEVSLAELMGVSRTPVREALVLLEREGLVISSPNRGFFVRQFTPSDVKYIFEMRTLFENYAAELNLEHFTHADMDKLDSMIEEQREATVQKDFARVRTIDMSFHRFLVGYSGQPLLFRNWSELVAQIAALLYLRADSIEYDEMRALSDHKRIVNGYRSQSLAEVEQANRDINNRVCSECVRAVELLIRG